MLPRDDARLGSAQAITKRARETAWPEVEIEEMWRNRDGRAVDETIGLYNRVRWLESISSVV